MLVAVRMSMEQRNLGAPPTTPAAKFLLPGQRNLGEELCFHSEDFRSCSCRPIAVPFWLPRFCKFFSPPTPHPFRLLVVLWCVYRKTGWRGGVFDLHFVDIFSMNLVS